MILGGKPDSCGFCSEPLASKQQVAELLPCGCLLCCSCWCHVLSSSGSTCCCPQCGEQCRAYNDRQVVNNRVRAVRHDIAGDGQPAQELEMAVVENPMRRRRVPRSTVETSPDSALAIASPSSTPNRTETSFAQDDDARSFVGSSASPTAPLSLGGGLRVVRMAAKMKASMKASMNGATTRAERVVAHERRALARVYASLGGDAWLLRANWLSDEPLSQWQGVQCDAKSGRICRLYLPHNNLRGTLYEGILAPCQQLRILDLSHNPDLGGPLPASLMAMKRLTLVDVSQTALTAFPPNM